ncbi:pentatricopeptide repeat-containing protein At4g04370-like [Elaeis guineensis]|uniref:pentatricopeptide repeat-containing protein At4g04370-like n=1 Tax=Elaeis guineensis var. tenera TaxID=51953 RepID=UPI003C6CD820
MVVANGRRNNEPTAREAKPVAGGDYRRRKIKKRGAEQGTLSPTKSDDFDRRWSCTQAKEAERERNQGLPRAPMTSPVQIWGEHSERLLRAFFDDPHRLVSRFLYPFALSRGNGIPSHPHAFPSLLKACASLGLLPLGLVLYLHAIVLGYFPCDPYIPSSLLHMYSQNGDLASAHRIFGQMPLPLCNTVVPWSAIIAAHSRAGDAAAAFSLYNQMRGLEIQSNSITLLALLLAAVSRLDYLQCLRASAIRHGFEADLVLVNSMLNVYATCGRPDLARRLFDSMPLRGIVSWNFMLSGYARTDGCVTGLMDLFRRMRVVRGINPDHQTYGSLISCFTNTKIALVSMYLKFGRLNGAFLLFDQAPDHRDIVSWTAMISDLAQNDGADKASVIWKAYNLIQ